MDTQAKVKLLDQNDLFHQLVWDYELSPAEFLAMLENKRDSWSYRWAAARTLTRAPYYTAMKLMDKKSLKKVWPEIRQTIKYREVVRAYDFVVSR